jgi:hypothetical protein
VSVRTETVLVDVVGTAAGAATDTGAAVVAVGIVDAGTVLEAAGDVAIAGFVLPVCAAATAVGVLGGTGGLRCFCHASHKRSPEKEKMISAMMRWVSILGVSIKKLGDRIVAASMPRMAA